MFKALRGGVSENANAPRVRNARVGRRRILNVRYGAVPSSQTLSRVGFREPPALLVLASGAALMVRTNGHGSHRCARLGRMALQFARDLGHASGVRGLADKAV
jgi:hypothetical protein